MPHLGFWATLKKPIIGLAPMDGVTDAVYRYMICKHGKPSVVMTEFTNVEGLARGAKKMLVAFEYDKIERPIVAQIYGSEVDSFYKVAVLMAYLGFDGVDINMGCPANKIARRGSGAGLIQTPDLAKEIVRSVKKGVEDWHNGITLEEADLRPKIIIAAKEMVKSEKRELIPVSVKTRVGYNTDIAEEWCKHLLEVEPAAITMHGRTFKQMYLGEANWESIAKAAKVAKGSDTIFLGNGDVKSMKDAKEKVKKYGVDGALVGRATFGNPLFFSGKELSVKQRAEMAIEHCKLYEKTFSDRPFYPMRKHLGWYFRGFDGAREMRKELMLTNSTKEVEKIVKPLLND